MVPAACANCVFDIRTGVAAYLGPTTEVMGFLIEHGIDPLAPSDFHPYAAVEEVILSPRPFEARYAFTVDDETLVVTVDDDLSVVDATSGIEREAD